MAPPIRDVIVSVRSARLCGEKPGLDKKIILRAMWLALLQKAASGLGSLSFIWATVVILGGLAGTLESIDFWFVTIILVAEGASIVGRSSELAAGVASGQQSYPYFKILLQWMRLYSDVIEQYAAVVFLAFSINRLASGHYGDSYDYHRNRALIIFYGLSLAESLLILVASYLKTITVIRPGYEVNEGVLEIWGRKWPKWLKWSKGGELVSKLWKWWWKWLRGGELVSEVSKEYGLRPDSQLEDTVRRFFYDAYLRCISGSVLDGMKMEFVSYSVELLLSSDPEEQLAGARVLSTLLNNNLFALDTLRAIGTTSGVVEKLIEMLHWEKFHEQKIRRAAAEVISKFVHGDRNRIQVTDVAWSMESIASLLYDSYRIEIHSRQYMQNQPSDVIYDYSGFSLLGLGILKSLAKNHDNCVKIGSDRALLSKIIGLTESNPNTAKVARHLIGMLASSTGSTGKRIWKIIFARDVLQNREISTHALQMLAIDTLTSLAREQEDRESIGGTGGVLHNLFSLFFMERINCNDEKKELVTKAGEALCFLSLESKHNCEIMISTDWSGRPNLIARLISVLNDPVQGIHGARILRNLHAYAEPDCFELEEITATASQVVVMMRKQGEHQEAAIGLAAQIFKFKTILDFDPGFKEQWSELKKSLISELVEVFRRHPRPSQEVPSIRRFSIELLIAVMEMDRSTIEMRLELVKALEGVTKTTSELESYGTFSGTVGLSSHCMAIGSLVQSAMVLLRNFDKDAEFVVNLDC